MAQKFRQLNEAFDYVFDVRAKKKQVERLKEVASTNQTIVPVVRWGVGAEQIDWGLPEGLPETHKIEDDIPEGMGDTTITLEWRRIRQFTDPASNMKNLPPWKQEMNWLQIIEGVHYKEAEFLTHVKDATLLKLYPKLEGILKDLGIEEYTPGKLPKKKVNRVDFSASTSE